MLQPAVRAAVAAGSLGTGIGAGAYLLAPGAGYELHRQQPLEIQPAPRRTKDSRVRYDRQDEDEYADREDREAHERGSGQQDALILPIVADDIGGRDHKEEEKCRVREEPVEAAASAMAYHERVSASGTHEDDKTYE